jgi:hypothetical protein
VYPLGGDGLDLFCGEPPEGIVLVVQDHLIGLADVSQKHGEEAVLMDVRCSQRGGLQVVGDEPGLLAELAQCCQTGSFFRFSCPCNGPPLARKASTRSPDIEIAVRIFVATKDEDHDTEAWRALWGKHGGSWNSGTGCPSLPGHHPIEKTPTGVSNVPWLDAGKVTQDL